MCGARSPIINTNLNLVPIINVPKYQNDWLSRTKVMVQKPTCLQTQTTMMTMTVTDMFEDINTVAMKMCESHVITVI